MIIDIVANHKRFFVFALCPNNNPDSDPDHDCFRRHPLRYSDGSSLHVLEPGMRNAETRVYLELQLPPGLSCWQCILQWTWVTANRWGKGRQTAEYWTKECEEEEEGQVGCGPQEAFRGCADICIGEGCPRDYCTRARPFNSSSNNNNNNGNNPKPPFGTDLGTPEIPQRPDQICIEAAIKEQFWSKPGDFYCKLVCLGHPMHICNLYLCNCNTKYYKQKDAAIERNNTRIGIPIKKQTYSYGIGISRGCCNNVWTG